jgi:hypothetical protein
MSPSSQHESLVRLFRNDARLAATLLAGLPGIELPPFQRVVSAAENRSELRSVAYRADVVVVLEGAGAEPVCGIVAEVQLGIDPGKRYSWPLYVASLRAERRVPVYLLVVAPDEAVARWARQPIPLGQPGLVLHPTVIGPAQVPVVTTLRRARQEPELAVLSALAHGDREHPVAQRVAEAALHAALRLDEDRSGDYISIVLRAVAPSVRARLEEAMRLEQLGTPTELELRLAARGEARGLIKAKAQDVLAVLTARGLSVPDAVRERVLACQDIEQLDTWLIRAVHAQHAEELLEGS